MITQAYRYKFRDGTDAADAEVTLHLAILAAEGLYGEARVRMDLGYFIDPTIGAIVVDASTDVGQDVNSMFTHFLIRQYGPGAFSVRPVEMKQGCACRADGQ